MLYYISSPAYDALIAEAAEETGQVIVGSSCEEDFYLKDLVEERLASFKTLELLVVDTDGIRDEEKEILAAFDRLKLTNNNLRIIVIAAGMEPGDKFLADCFARSITDLVTGEGFSEIKASLTKSLLGEKNYSDTIKYRDYIPEAKRKKKQRPVDHVTIGVCGTQERIGCTHAAIMLASALKERGYITAVLEENSTGAFGQIRDFYEIKTIKPYFNKAGIDFYPAEDAEPEGQDKETEGQDKESEKDQMRKAYNFLIKDFGMLTQENYKAYEECRHKFCITGVKPWESGYIQETFGIIRELEQMKQIRWCFNLCPESMKRDVTEGMAELKENVHFLSFMPDPFTAGKMEGLDELLKEYTPGRVEVGKKK